MNCPKNRGPTHSLKLRFAASPQSKQNKFSASKRVKDLRKKEIERFTMANRNSKAATKPNEADEQEGSRQHQVRNPYYRSEASSSTGNQPSSPRDSGIDNDTTRPATEFEFVNVNEVGRPIRASTPMSERDRAQQRYQNEQRIILENRQRHDLDRLRQLATDQNLLGIVVRNQDGQRFTIRQAAHYVARHDFENRNDYTVQMNLMEFGIVALHLDDENPTRCMHDQVNSVHEQNLQIHDHLHRVGESLDTLRENQRLMRNRIDMVLTNSKKSEQYGQIAAVGELARRKRTNDNAFPIGPKSVNNNFQRKLAEKHGLVNQLDDGGENQSFRCPRCNYDFYGNNEDSEEDDGTDEPENYETPAKKRRQDQNPDDHDQGGHGAPVAV